MFTRPRIKSFVILAILAILVVSLSVTAVVQTTAFAKPLTWDNGVARTPQMGWNSWNHFGCAITDTLIRAQADAMVSSGMAAAGYQYINLDDCWAEMARDSSGNLQGSVTKFPNGIKALADYVHSKGLKFGVYGDRGTTTCASYPGSYGHETADANTLAAWGVDYLKYDNCAPVGDLVTAYTTMHNALAATGRPILFSICAWWMASPTFVDLGNSWRTTSDITDSFGSAMNIMDTNNNTAQYGGPGHWNDPDMLEVGNGGMTDTEYRAHFAMWAMMAAPLISGNDMTTMSAATLAILTAPEVIAVDQDALGVQGSRVVDNGDLEVWSKTLSGANTKAVALLNRSASAASITVNWSDIGLSGSAAVRDLWAKSDLGSFSGSYSASVPAHGVVLIKIVAGGSTQATSTPTRTFTPGTPVTNTPTRTVTLTSPVITNTPTRTNTPGITNTPSRTSTAGITNTPTRTPTRIPDNTPTIGYTNTVTRTPTAGPSNTPTLTPTPYTGPSCPTLTGVITAPFTQDGAGAFCWQATSLGSYVNSWNLTSLRVGGLDYTNVYLPAASYPAKTNGYWIVSYNSTVAYGHFETK